MGKNVTLLIVLLVVILACAFGINAYIGSLHKAEDALDAPEPSAPHGTAKPKSAAKPGTPAPSNPQGK